MITVRFWPKPSKVTPAVETSPVLDDELDSVRLLGVSTSVIVNGMVMGVSSLVTRLVMVAIVGLVLTVSTKELLPMSSPSLTRRVIVAVPRRPGCGVTVTVPFSPFRWMAMLASGTRVGLDELLNSVRFAGAVSASPIVKGIAGVGVLGRTN